MYPIQPVAKRYAWGSYTRLQRMFASCPSPLTPLPEIGEPLAEMWFSGHSGSPSTVETSVPILLPELIKNDPEGMLGARCSEQFGPVLPYLLKIISARIPLSLQVHPVDFEARRGFNAQNAAGVALDSPERSFSDPVAKSEMVVALEPFEASIGFAPVATMLANLTLVEHPVARRMVRELTPHRTGFPLSAGRVGNPSGSTGAVLDSSAVSPTYPDGFLSETGGLGFEASAKAGLGADQVDAIMPPSAQYWSPSRRRVFRAFCAAVCATPEEGKGLAHALRQAAAQVGEEKASLAFKHAMLASQTFSEDPSSLALLMMNSVALQEGEAVFIPAGTPHAYIHGTAAEIMTNSDNVLRAGLTAKHKDIVDFLHTLDCRPASPIDPSVNLPEALSGDRVVYRPHISEFMLIYGRVGGQGRQWPLVANLTRRYGRLVAGVRHLQRHHGPRIVVCTQGVVQCATANQQRILHQGEALFVPACDGWLEFASRKGSAGENEGAYVCASTQI